MTRRSAALVVGAAVLTTIAAAVLVHSCGRPPREADVLRRFHAHRAAYERLREMLEVDQQVRRVASWGVETATSVGRDEAEPGHRITFRRYAEYLENLRVAEAIAAGRGEGARPDVDILVWASGFAGHTRHVCIQWLERSPANQVATLDERETRPRQGRYRHIEDHWYIWTDL